MLYIVAVVLVVLWALGLIGHMGGDLIHFLFVAALVVLIYRVISDSRRS